MAETKKTPQETCYGCGAKSEAGKEHPILGVINKNDVESGTRSIPNPETSSDFVGVPVCADCHRDPKHRTSHPLKCHFFERKGNIAKMALMLAGSADIGG